MSGERDDLPELPDGPPPHDDDRPLPDLPEASATPADQAEAPPPPLGDDLPLPDLPDGTGTLPDLGDVPPAPLGDDLPLPDLPDGTGALADAGDAPPPPTGDDLPLPDLPEGPAAEPVTSLEPDDAAAPIAEQAPADEPEVEAEPEEAEPDRPPLFARVGKALAGVGPYAWFLILSFSALLMATLVLVAELSSYGFHIKPS